MESWVKGNPNAEVVQPIGTVDSQPIPVSFEGVPLDIIRFFDIDTRTMDNKTKEKLNDIYKFSNSEGKPMGDILQGLKMIEYQMGQSVVGESRYGRIWNYLRVQNTINDLVKQRDSLLRY